MNLKNPFGNNNDPFRMLYTDPDVFETMSEKIISWLPKTPRDYVIVCIGTDRSTGDALGPLTGTIFQEMKPKHMTIYGTLHDPVHATNLTETIDAILYKHKDPYIIAVDACLGKSSSIGHLIAAKGPLKPGAALNKTLPPIGDMHITAVVNMGGFMEYSVLQNTRLSIVMDMAKKVAEILSHIDGSLTYSYPITAIIEKHHKERRSI